MYGFGFHSLIEPVNLGLLLSDKHIQRDGDINVAGDEPPKEIAQSEKET